MRWINPSGSIIMAFATDSCAAVALIVGSALTGWQAVSSAIIRIHSRKRRIITSSEQIQHSSKECLRDGMGTITDATPLREWHLSNRHGQFESHKLRRA